jgi:hypothetical protein
MQINNKQSKHKNGKDLSSKAHAFRYALNMLLRAFQNLEKEFALTE